MGKKCDHGHSVGTDLREVRAWLLTLKCQDQFQESDYGQVWTWMWTWSWGDLKGTLRNSPEERAAGGPTGLQEMRVQLCRQRFFACALCSVWICCTGDSCQGLNTTWIPGVKIRGSTEDSPWRYPLDFLILLLKGVFFMVAYSSVLLSLKEY